MLGELWEGDSKSTFRERMCAKRPRAACFDWLDQQPEASVVYVATEALPYHRVAGAGDSCSARKQRPTILLGTANSGEGEGVAGGVFGEDEVEGYCVHGVGSAAAHSRAQCHWGLRVSLRLELGYGELVHGRAHHRHARARGPNDERHPDLERAWSGDSNQ